MLLSVDFGTGGCKITIIYKMGDILAVSSAEYSTSHPNYFIVNSIRQAGFQP
jgi:hypothetical protein